MTETLHVEVAKSPGCDLQIEIHAYVIAEIIQRRTFATPQIATKTANEIVVYVLEAIRSSAKQEIAH